MKTVSGKIIVVTICLFIIGSLCGCTPKTEYDDKQIYKIETSWVEGMSLFRCDYVRTFDFQSNTVTDNWVADLDSIAEEDSSLIDKERYNNPTVVVTFDDENGQALLKKLKSLGFLAWKDRYVTSDEVCDAGSEWVTVYFTDGTVKSTYIYCEDPPGYDKVQSEFKERLGVALYSRWWE